MTTWINTLGKGAVFLVFQLFNPKCLGSVQSKKVFLYGQTNESKIFLWQNCFGGTPLVLRGFFCWVLVFFSPSCPMEDFSSVKRNSQYTACVSPGNLPLIGPLKINKDHNNRTPLVLL